MRRLVVALVVALIAVSTASVWAFNCPVVIKQAEDLIKKAESGKVTTDTKPLI